MRSNIPRLLLTSYSCRGSAGGRLWFGAAFLRTGRLRLLGGPGGGPPTGADVGAAKAGAPELGDRRMNQGYSMIGFVVIVILYAVIGLLASRGTILTAQKVLAPRAEQIFYAVFLIMIAAFYLAFAAYFGATTPW